MAPIILLRPASGLTVSGTTSPLLVGVELSPVTALTLNLSMSMDLVRLEQQQLPSIGCRELGICGRHF